ncbi:hypothetical protein [Streptomyces sp. enrichment culture]|jgi:hypothetical protein|uniref:hypothetical protein n=1 Tax=Streptomyces sp. enrichment culture TaxID=1795815 RepID=UPI003F57D194
MDKRQVRGAGVMVGAVLVVGGVALLTADHTPPPPELSERWVSDPMPQVQEPDDVVATWLTDDTVVAVTAHGTWALEAATGQRRWNLNVRETSLAPCAASPEPNADGIAAMIFEDVAGPPDTEESRRCDTVGAVDTRTGELLWSVRLDGALRWIEREDPPVQPSGWVGVPVTTGNEVITVDLGGGISHRFSLDGTELPLPEAPDGDRCPDGMPPEGTRWVQGREHTLVIPLCWERTVTAFATGSGEELWTAPTEAGWTQETYAILSDAPLVVGTTASAAVYGPDGNWVATSSYRAGLNGTPLLLGESLLVAPGGYAPDRWLKGFDLASDTEWIYERPEGSVLAGAREDHVLLLSPAGPAEDDEAEKNEDGGDYHLLRVGAANGETAEEGIIRTRTVIAAVTDEETLYTITLNQTPGRHWEARLVAHGLPR